jgi:cyclophilin family peptidyl-prolyl cis-trans isomerase
MLREKRAGGLPPAAGAAGTRATTATYELAAAMRQDRTLAVVETARGNMEIELFRQDAPLTVDNFVFLARRGFYDGLTFMRVAPYFMVQGGDPREDQEGGPGYAIRCEINMRPFGRGSVGMALSGKDTGGSQFFITLAPQPHLDGGYTCFGHVISGMEAADRLVPGDSIRSIRIVEEVALLDYRRF